ncbi:transposase [Telmatocola sphagniphila]|uniref:Transposase n=1 Tax=Telmatocola sphagniphila TaxID=1123043 RepID=A0A8E6EWJ1_9BACT|nr:transposase [Telmatocola sphagniphila]
MDWEPFITMLKNNWDGILAYFEERKSSGPVEGLNTKIRVVLRRSYGIQSLTTLWTRVRSGRELGLEKNRADHCRDSRLRQPNLEHFHSTLQLKTDEPFKLSHKFPINKLVLIKSLILMHKK